MPTFSVRLLPMVMSSLTPTFLSAVIVNRNFFVMADVFGAVMADFRGFVVFYDIVLIFFGMDVKLLGAFFIFHSDFIEIRAAATLGTSAFDAALSFVGGQCIRHEFGRRCRLGQ